MTGSMDDVNVLLEDGDFDNAVLAEGHGISFDNPQFSATALLGFEELYGLDTVAGIGHLLIAGFPTSVQTAGVIFAGWR